jgi:hypothetical protein
LGLDYRGLPCVKRPDKFRSLALVSPSTTQISLKPE